MTTLSKLSGNNLPDICLLALISQMTLEDRLSAHQVCPAWYHRAREVNMKICRSLTIIVNSLTPIQTCFSQYLNCDVFSSETSLRTFAAGLSAKERQDDRYSALFFPHQHQQTPMRYLEFSGGQLTAATVRQLKTAFPGITELTFLTCTYNQKTGRSMNRAEYRHLLRMLLSRGRRNHDDDEGNWTGQLTTLRVLSSDLQKFTSHREAFNEALNGLTALRHLELVNVCLHWQAELTTALSRLEKLFISFSSAESFDGLILSLGLPQLRRPPSSRRLQVSLQYGLEARLPRRQQLTSLRRCLGPHIVRLAHGQQSQLDAQEAFLPLIDDSSGLCQGLVSLTLATLPFDAGQVLARLAADLPRLLHLSLHLSFKVPADREEELAALLSGGRLLRLTGRSSAAGRQTPQQQLRSVRALDLTVRLTRGPLENANHGQLRWLNIGQLMPRLRALHLNLKGCEACGGYSLYQVMSEEATRRATACLRQCLSIVAGSTGLPPERITHHRQVLFGSTEQLFNSD
ncbi:hypothetical protein TYRP_017320 [Tyrophagus putrescentiae]|nr:hypothetical protein TYRP_017320 [Tyrophagus putrescentiae]